MATLSQLRSYVVDTVRDSALGNPEIDKLLNLGVSEIAGGMQSSMGDSITFPLPELFSIDTVDTDIDEAYVLMPGTFGRGLIFVSDSNGREIDICNSMIEFSENYPLMNRSSDVVSAIELGGNLYYQGIPVTTEELTLHFYRLPVPMTAKTDTPDGIPLSMQVTLLINYVAYKVYEITEDGVNRKDSKYNKHKSIFQEALKVLELYIPYDSRPLYLKGRR